jgi:hypothetical protein
MMGLGRGGDTVVVIDRSRQRRDVTRISGMLCRPRDEALATKPLVWWRTSHSAPEDQQIDSGIAGGTLCFYAGSLGPLPAHA